MTSTAETTPLTHPPFGTPRRAGLGPVPRVIDPNERATPGTVRFKIGCRNTKQPITKYVLAANATDAAMCYLQAVGPILTVDGQPPELATTAIAD